MINFQLCTMKSQDQESKFRKNFHVSGNLLNQERATHSKEILKNNKPPILHPILGPAASSSPSWDRFLSKPKNKDHVTCLSNHVSRLLIFLSLRVYIKGKLGIFLKSLRLYRGAKLIWVESSEFFQVPGHLYREKAIQDDSHLASLGASLF